MAASQNAREGIDLGISGMAIGSSRHTLSRGNPPPTHPPPVVLRPRISSFPRRRLESSRLAVLLLAARISFARKARQQGREIQVVSFGEWRDPKMSIFYRECMIHRSQLKAPFFRSKGGGRPGRNDHVNNNIDQDMLFLSVGFHHIPG